MADIERYLPARFGEIDEFVEFCKALDPEYDEIRDLREKWLKNKYPCEADKDGIAIWEQVLGIKPSINDSLEARRAIVIAKLNERLPYTYIQLHRMMAAICGWDGFDLKLKDFVLMAMISMEAPERYAAVKQLLIDVLPAHIYIRLIEFLEGDEKQGIASNGWVKRIVSTHTPRRTQDIMLASGGRVRRVVETHTPRQPKRIYTAGAGKIRIIVKTYTPPLSNAVYAIGWGRLIKQVSTGNY